MESQQQFLDRPSVSATIWGVLRVLIAAGAVIVAYMLAPGIGENAVPGWVVACAGLAIFTAVAIWQIRVVANSDKPIYRAIEALAVLGLLFLALFALEYTAISAYSSSAFSEALDKFSAMYYAITVFSTVGFGDITPVSTSARTATMVQMIGNLIFLGAVVRVVSGVAKSSKDRMESDSSNTGVDVIGALADGKPARSDALGAGTSD